MHIHLDPIGGIAGDMFVAALADLRPDLVPGLEQTLESAEALGGGVGAVVSHHDGVLTGTRFRVSPRRSKASSACKSGGHSHVAWRTIRERLQGSGLAKGIVAHALEIFQYLAEAEAKVHGKPVEDVSFHEVGAWDSIADIVAAAYLLDTLPDSTWSVDSIPTGSGRISGSHGLLPLPAPATVELLKGFVLHDDGVSGERVTPTGAAIIRHIAPTYRPTGVLGRLSGSGNGFGTRDLAGGTPNMLRALAFIPQDPPMPATCDKIAVLSFDIDDQTGEDLAMACANLRRLDDVLDVIQTPGFGKKGRLVTQIRVLSRPESAENIASACLNETTTLGVRLSTQWRRILSRSEATVDAEGRAIPVKRALRPDGSITAKAAADAFALLPGGHTPRQALRERVETASLDRHEDIKE